MFNVQKVIGSLQSSPLLISIIIKCPQSINLQKYFCLRLELQSIFCINEHHDMFKTFKTNSNNFEGLEPILYISERVHVIFKKKTYE